MKKSGNEINAYIAKAPKGVRGKLSQLRSAIRAAAPLALERISYGMPYFAYKGRVAYFRNWKNFIGLYIPTPVLEDHQKELKNYDTAKATIRFPLDKPLPIGLIKKLIKARVKRNLTSEKAKRI